MDRTLHEIEHEAWMERAEYYDSQFGPMTAQAVEPILASLSRLAGQRHLDVACGTGTLAAAAAARGAVVEGVDFASAMIEAARAAYPKINFQVADAADLPYSDGSWDTVSCSFGFSHMQNPAAALKEVHRVLRPGGRLAFTLWCSGEDGGELAALFSQALRLFGQAAISLPESWTRLRFASQAACAELTRQAGFGEPVFERLPITWRLQTAEEGLKILTRMAVRSKILLESQPPAARARIEGFIREALAARATANGIALAGPALLTVVSKQKE